MRRSISASSFDQLAALFLARRGFGLVAWLRGSGGGIVASSCLICASSTVCCCLHRFDLPLRILGRVAHLRSGPRAAAARWRGPCRASPPPASEVCAMAWALSALLVGLGVDQDHFQRRILEDAVEASGSTKRTVSRTACTATETPSAICRVLNVAQVHEGGLSPGQRCASSVSSTSTAMAIGPATGSSSPLLPRRPSAAASHRAVRSPCRDVQRDLVDLAQLHPHPGAARQVRAAQDRQHQRQVVGAHQALRVLEHGRLEFGRCLAAAGT